MDIRDVKAKVDGHISDALVLTLRPKNDLDAPAVDAVIQSYFAGLLTGMGAWRTASLNRRRASSCRCWPHNA